MHGPRARQRHSLAAQEHATMLDEMYVYFNIAEATFGIQLVYNNTDYPALITAVRVGDAVFMPSG